MTARLGEASALTSILHGLDDAGVRTLIDDASQTGIGIGGTTKTASLDGTNVFIKQLPLTSVEEADPRSTVSRLRLPFVSHYGIGTPANSVGRELAAHQVTTRWVQSGLVDFFPLLLGWRVLDLKSEANLSEFDGDAPSSQWGPHWPEVQGRLSAMKAASKSMVLFLEYVPLTLGNLIRRSLREGFGAEIFPGAVDQILEATAWMNRQGFQHFDVHPGNILIRNGRLLYTDFGLALHKDFELTPEETAGMRTHDGFDRDSALMHLFHWTLFELGYISGEARLGLLHAASAGTASPALAPVRAALGSGADLIAQHADTAIYITEMFAALTQDVHAAEYRRLG